MLYKLTGSVELRIPESDPVEINAENRKEAVLEFLKLYLKDREDVADIVTDYLKAKRVRKVFTVSVTQTHKNTVEIDTDEYPGITTEEEAAEYVADHIDEFDMEFEYNYTTEEDDPEVDCEVYDTEEEEVECYD